MISSFHDEMITMSNLDTAEAVVLPNTRRVSHSHELAKTYRFRPDVNGFDITVTLTNETNVEQVAGHITLGGFQFGQVIDYIDLRYDTKMDSHDHGGENYFGASRKYPRSLYSPALVFGDDEYWIGVSIQYPLVEYDHGVSLMVRSPGGSRAANGRNWEANVELETTLQPGETRTYTVSCRAVQREDHWTKTLVPYRNYFHRVYGPVTYQRDARPAKSFNMAARTQLSQDNPYGFSEFDGRPDIAGWEPLVEWFEEMHSEQGHERVMIWAPTGLHLNHQALNYPFKFMTHMHDMPPMYNSRLLLRDVFNPPNYELGLWWGRSLQVMREWDDGNWEPLDPDNPEHVQLALAELDMAREMGATMIGLDAYVYAAKFSHSFRWLTKLRQHAPEIRFIIEPMAPDLLHFQAATFTYSHLVETPHVLADFLLPGHEIWAHMRFYLIEAEIGRELTDGERDAEIQRIADLGYVPLIPGQIIRRRPFHAAESWRTSLPREVQMEAPQFNSNYNQDRVVFQQNGRPTMVRDAMATNGNATPATSGSGRRFFVSGSLPISTNVSKVITDRNDRSTRRSGIRASRRGGSRSLAKTMVVTGDERIVEDEYKVSIDFDDEPMVKDTPTGRVITLPGQRRILPKWANAFIDSAEAVRSALSRAELAPHADDRITVVPSRPK